MVSTICLTDLPNETLLDIIAYQHDKEPTSLTCKRLNFICGHWFFKKYHLRFRVEKSNSRLSTPLIALDTPKTLLKWNRGAVLTRLAHLRDKAPHVRELIIHNASEKHMDLFPEDIIPILEYTLKMCTKVLSVQFKTESPGKLPMCFWEWFSAIGLQKVNIGRLTPPSGQLKLLDQITAYEGCLYDETRPFLESIDPKEIKLNYYQYYNNTPRISLFKPSNDQFRRLTMLNIKLTYDCRGEQELFDFSAIPQTSIEVIFTLLVEYKMHIPIVWKTFKRSLPKIFVEDINGFDVSRSRTIVAISRPSKQYIIKTGWTPSSSDHMESEKEEQKEQAAMNRYYESRLQKQLKDMGVM
ncbi:hypothetical protein BJ138DRAFT_1167142 [Hygrophoropsis aurantiaca]|uniref:Uncharacterized protein n=1 Tax=Hygrophoropsis aurantiaca TaxID=72124 RepID=A0ACB7ZSH7_9AGAM|nr:hypothetical protein BJ138DRAFT_1167142 [Hygrophoropsis aurantiaca]